MSFFKKIILNRISVSNFLRLSKLLNLFFSRKPNNIFVPDFFEVLSQRTEKVNFIQIGSNDGSLHDPLNYFIKKYNWKGVLVEPLPYIFKKLKLNYDGISDLIFVNAGIGVKDGQSDFYCLDETYINPNWLQQIGSFDKEAIIRNLVGKPDLISAVQKISLDMITLKTLVKKTNYTKIDVLHIDAEGFEFIILSQLKDISLIPSFILFERGSMSEPDYDNTCSLLEQLDYKLYDNGADILAINKV